MTAHKTRKNANVEKSKSKLCTIYTIDYDTCRQTNEHNINSWRQSQGHPLQETVANTSVVLVDSRRSTCTTAAGQCVKASGLDIIRGLI